MSARCEREGCHEVLIPRTDDLGYLMMRCPVCDLGEKRQIWHAFFERWGRTIEAEVKRRAAEPPPESTLPKRRCDWPRCRKWYRPIRCTQRFCGHDCKMADQRAAMALRAVRAKEAGLCPWCAKRPKDGGFVTCAECRGSRNASARRRWKRRAA